MQKNSHSLQNHILPIGFTVIIVLMVCGTFLISGWIEKEHQKINDIQAETNEINRLLVAMSDAEYQRTIILFQILQNNEEYLTEDFSIALEYQEVKLADVRNKLPTFDLTRIQHDYFTLHGKLSSQNTANMGELINLFSKDKSLEYNLMLKETILPEIRYILRVISKLHKETNKKAIQRTNEIEVISNKMAKDIFSFNLLIIFSIFMMLWFLRRKQRQTDAYLSLKASTDQLTGLPNKNSFVERLNKTISKKPKEEFSIVFLDVDHFKGINDNYGHKSGDIVLQQFSKIIENLITNEDILSRFGGDEFVLLVKHNNNKEKLDKTIKNISKALDTSFHIGGDEIFISASIGVSTYPFDGADASSLLKNSDIAMYGSKKNGRNCYQFFSLDDSKKLEHEHTLSHALQTILKNNNEHQQLSMVYQPLINIVDNSFNECEALVRCTDTDGNPISTVDFIEVAEKSNLIEKLNTFVIEEVCKQQEKWQKEGANNIRVNINLSGNKRIFSQLFRCLSENVTKYNLNPKLFGIELTERTIYEISQETYKELDYFRKIGMKIAIDDFGTGYSSLSYLKRLPITSLKIDREFITGLPDSKVDVALVKAILTLAHSLNYDVIAEGVETQEQFDFLKECKCHIAQGYLLHRPLKPEKIKQLKLVS